MAATGPGSRKNNPEFERTTGPKGGVGYRRVAGADHARAVEVGDSLPDMFSGSNEDDGYWDRVFEVSRELDFLAADADFTLLDGGGNHITTEKAVEHVVKYEGEGYPLGVYASYPLRALGANALMAEVNREAIEDAYGRLPDHWEATGDSVKVPVEDLLDDRHPDQLRQLASIRDYMLLDNSGAYEEKAREAIAEALPPEYLEERAGDLVHEIIEERLEAAREDGAPESVESLPAYDEMLTLEGSIAARECVENMLAYPGSYIQSDGTVWYGDELDDAIREHVEGKIDGLFR